MSSLDTLPDSRGPVPDTPSRPGPVPTPPAAADQTPGPGGQVLRRITRTGIRVLTTGDVIRALSQPTVHTALLYGAPALLVIGLLISIWRKTPVPAAHAADRNRGA
jgi:hypothetical protein